MGVNQEIFEQYVHSDKDALSGMPVQKQAKFRELRDVLSRSFDDYPEEMKPEFSIALTGTQNSLMAKCNEAIEELDAEKFRNFLEVRKDYDIALRTLSNNSFNSLYTDRNGNKYDERHGKETRLEKVFTSYSREFDQCNEMLAVKVNSFYSRGRDELVAFFPGFLDLVASTKDPSTIVKDVRKMELLAKLFSLCHFFNSFKLQLAQGVILARKKNNSDSAIARVLETDAKKLNRMVEDYQTKTVDAAPAEEGVLTVEGPMKAASAQRKLFTERKDKPEYAFVAYLVSHQDGEGFQGFQSDLLREVLQTVNYCSFALAVRNGNEDVEHPVNAYLFKLRITRNFLKQYDYAITPVYEELKKLGVKDDLIQCVLYEGSKEFKKRVERAQRA